MEDVLEDDRKEEIDICAEFKRLKFSDTDGLFDEGSVRVSTRNEKTGVTLETTEAPKSDEDYEKLCYNRWSIHVLLEKILIENDTGKIITWKECYEKMEEIHLKFAGNDIGIKYVPFVPKLDRGKKKTSTGKRRKTLEQGEEISVVVMSINQLYAVLLYKKFTVPKYIASIIEDPNDETQRKEYEKRLDAYVDTLPGKLCIKSLKNLTSPWVISKTFVVKYLASYMFMNLLYIATEEEFIIARLPRGEILKKFKYSDLFREFANIWTPCHDRAIEGKVTIHASQYMLVLSIDGKNCHIFTIGSTTLRKVGSIAPKDSYGISSLCTDNDMVIVGCYNGNVDFWKLTTEQDKIEFTGTKNYFGRDYVTDSGKTIETKIEAIHQLVVRGSRIIVTSNSNIVMVDMKNIKYGITVCAINDAETTASLCFFGDLLGMINSRGILTLSEFGSGKIFHNSVFPSGAQPAEHAISIGSQLCSITTNMFVGLLPDGTLAVLDHYKSKRK